LGLGWLHWAMTNDCNCYEGWYANWPLMLNDALLKSWYWQKDPFGEPDSIAPTTPTSVIADKITGNSCNLKWNVSNDDKGVSFYAVFNGTKYLGVSLTNSYVLSGLTQNTSYSITIKARDAAGNWSNASSEITVKTLENIALNKTAEASSVATTLYSAAKAVDGNASTQWRSANSDTNPTLTIDLGNFYTLNNIKLSWSTSYATGYLIEISNDGSTFTTLKSLSGQNGGDDEIVGLSATTRFVRISVKTRSATTGVYLNSAEIYGTFAWATAATAIQLESFEIFPNPTKDIFFVRGENIASIEILTLSGSLVFKNNNTTRIDMSNYKNGIYLVRIKDGNRTVVKKLVKE
jgi:chitodextrinase